MGSESSIKSYLDYWKITYTPRRFGADSMELIDTANEIISDYHRQGYNLTLRQLYYQFVARDIIPNSDKSYKRLGELINAGRLAGLVSWRAIEDRTRNLAGYPSWESPAQIIKAAASSIAVDLWKDQPYRIEVWVEKEALAGVIQRPAARYKVPYLSCRGYMSQSEMWSAAQRYISYLRDKENPQDIVIIHLGDHDPSGIDMTRDIQDRLNLFINDQGYTANYGDNPVTVRRIALNRYQVDEYNPPPNPAKITDSRAGEYIREHGEYSWELDALQPQLINDLIVDEINIYRDAGRYEARQAIEQSWRDGLKLLSDNWESTYAPMLGVASIPDEDDLIDPDDDEFDTDDDSDDEDY